MRYYLRYASSITRSASSGSSVMVNNSASVGKIALYFFTSVSFIHSTNGFQNALPNKTTATGGIFFVCTSVNTSIAWWSVPSPPGNITNPFEGAVKTSFRVNGNANASDRDKNEFGLAFL